jgi:hypothetical protein
VDRCGKEASALTTPREEKAEGKADQKELGSDATWKRVGKFGQQLIKVATQSHVSLANATTVAGLGLPTLCSTESKPTKREAREAENAVAPGGLRSPWRYVRSSPAARRVGEGISRLIGQFMNDHPYVEGWLLDEKGPGREKMRGPIESDLVNRLASYLKAKDTRKGKRSQWSASIVGAYVREARDPDRHLAEWLENGVPTGVQIPIPASGVFPKVETVAEATAELWRYYAQTEAKSNYKSAEENALAVTAEVDRLINLGYITKYDKLEDVHGKLGQVIVSKIAAIIKVRDDGTVKLRIIIDMLRSMVNSFVKLSERIVLPRLMDVVTDLLALAEAAKRDNIVGEGISMMVADFVDAFHSLGVKVEELPFQVIKLPGGGYGGYETAVFGGGGSPLTWGLAAALLGRSGQSLFCDTRARIEIYVDDPWTCWRGTKQHIRRMKCTLLLWWLVLGPEISWAKVQHGGSVKWIGAMVRVSDTLAAVLSLPSEYAAAIECEAKRLLELQSASMKSVRRLAGKASWIGGYIPAVGAMIAPLWAALGAAPGDDNRQRRRAGDGADLVPIVRIRHALRWLVAFATGRSGSMKRTFTVKSHKACPKIVLEFDASPWGYGGVLWQKGRPTAYFGLRISDEDIEKFGMVVGDHRYQTLAENLAMLIGVRHWLPLWKTQRLQVIVRSDSTAALGAWTKERSKSPAVNEVVREAALDMAEGLYRIDFREHVPGKENLLPDALSRLHQPGAGTDIPVELASCKRVWPVERGSNFWRASLEESWEAGVPGGGNQ